MESLALGVEFLDEGGAPAVAGGMSAAEDVLVILCRVLAERAPVGITGVVLADKLAGREHFVTELDKVGAALWVGGGEAVGIPADRVGNVWVPAVSF